MGERSFLAWFAKNVAKAYVVLCIGVVLSFVVSGVLYDRAVDRIDAQARANCEAGNERTQLQKEDLIESRRQLDAADLTVVLGLSPAQAEQTRRLAAESSDRRLARLPFLDCSTGKRIPVP